MYKKEKQIIQCTYYTMLYYIKLCYSILYQLSYSITFMLCTLLCKQVQFFPKAQTGLTATYTGVLFYKVFGHKKVSDMKCKRSLEAIAGRLEAISIRHLFLLVWRPFHVGKHLERTHLSCGDHCPRPDRGCCQQRRPACHPQDCQGLREQGR